MQVCHEIDQTRQAVITARRAGRTVGFVPTMGALHAGHLSLVDAARKETDFVVVSIYVNPIQFGPAEDVDTYPRPLQADLDLCRQHGVDLVFAPSDRVMYGQTRLTTVHVADITEPLCGRHRPGHFDGVTTVVAKLFNIIPADVAYFGQKDAQQALVIRRMVRDLNIPIQIRIGPTTRESDGLALSSRNKYLDPEQRKQAACLYKALTTAKEAVAAGRRDCKVLIEQMKQVIHSAGPARIDYIAIVDPATLNPLETVAGPALIALAVKIGQARLIDNIVLDEDGREITINGLSVS